MPCDMTRYPSDWPQIRARILERAGYRCERCGVRNHAVGYRDAEGGFVRARGNGPADAAGWGQQWPSLKPLSYGEARQFCEVYNCCADGRDDDGNRWIVIVLTIAHVHDPDPANCAEDNLLALCQRCHNVLDAPMRAANRAATRQARKDAVQPCLEMELLPLLCLDGPDETRREPAG